MCPVGGLIGGRWRFEFWLGGGFGGVVVDLRWWWQCPWYSCGGGGGSEEGLVVTEWVFFWHRCDLPGRLLGCVVVVLWCEEDFGTC